MRVGPRRSGIREGASEDVQIAIAGEVTIYSMPFVLYNATNHSFECLAFGTTVNLKIEVEQGNVLPTIDGSADTVNWSVPSGVTEIIDGLTQKTHYMKSYSPVTSELGRLKILGKSGNTGDVYILAWWTKLEDL